MEFSNITFSGNKLGLGLGGISNPNIISAQNASFKLAFLAKEIRGTSQEDKTYFEMISKLNDLQKSNFKEFFKEYQTFVIYEKSAISSFFDNKIDIISLEERTFKINARLDTISKTLHKISSSDSFEKICECIDNKQKFASTNRLPNPANQVTSPTASSSAIENARV